MQKKIQFDVFFVEVFEGPERFRKVREPERKSDSMVPSFGQNTLEIKFANAKLLRISAQIKLLEHHGTKRKQKGFKPRFGFKPKYVGLTPEELYTVFLRPSNTTHSPDSDSPTEK